MSTTANGNQSPRPQPPTSSAGSGRELAIPIKKSVAFFDLDKTIIATSSAYAYGKEFFNSGLITPAEALQMSMAKASYMFSGHSSEQMDASKDQLSQMVAGWDVEEIKKIASETMHEVVVPTIYAEARDLINRHRGQGRDVVIISASASTLVDTMANMLDEGASLNIQGFGTYEVKKKKERIIVHPTTKQRQLVPPKLVIAFKPSQTLKDKVNA